MQRMKELAKFASGFEAFHALANAYFWTTNASFPLFGVVTTLAMHLTNALVNAAIAVALGVYGLEALDAGRPSIAT
ncbi:MAG: hypothetical protein ACT6S0_09100 [Roseateles sp.]|uniref:hypothetical protein n=1 Tax=Roseateles sp. TaxID=1971397 RepID=UPI00403622BD